MTYELENVRETNTINYKANAERQYNITIGIIVVAQGISYDAFSRFIMINNIIMIQTL